MSSSFELSISFGITDIENRVSKHSSGHIRAFIYKDIYKLLNDYNFKKIHMIGRDFYMPLIRHDMKCLGKINDLLSNIFPKLSAGFIVVAKK